MKTICEQLGIKVEARKPFKIKDSNNNLTYSEDSNGCWQKCQYNSNGNLTCRENSNGYWSKTQYDDNGNKIYYENSNGTIIDERVKTLTIDEIAKKFNIPVERLTIVKDKEANTDSVPVTVDEVITYINTTPHITNIKLVDYNGVF